MSVRMNPKTDPLKALEDNYRRACNEGQAYAEAVTLATVTADGRPNARTVLYKGQGDGGIVFYTNYESEKAKELARTPHAALVFFWPSIVTQVRVQGPVSKVEPALSDEYFRSRPRDRQIGAWASPQSQKVEGRASLDQRFDEFRDKFDGQQIQRPPHWGGFLLRAECMEFWFDRPGRMHDRFRYDRDGGGWRMSMLAP